MPRIVSIEEGALGTVKAVADEGSLFLYRACYLAMVADTAVPFDVPDDVLAAAVEATLAESRAVSLLARAEQFRAALERKLLARGMPRAAIAAALDRLEAVGLLSDDRYAESWIRQRIRTRAEGPRSLAAALSARGVDRHAVKRAVAQAFDGDERREERLEIISRIAVKLLRKGLDRAAARMELVELGWRRGDIDDAFDSMEP
ncbi:MAG: hypothetical protein CVV47_15260 [Spirochaetae bacterium HGW-Spirochaetae-3]|nr:MAG: hypothetical protein CVV47_15260 [Spirochaetae bacterium HGW-Spirochaetae-3]